MELQIRQLTKSGKVEVVGSWSTQSGLMWKTAENSEDEIGIIGDAESLLKKKKALVISTVLSPPYTMERLDSKLQRREGNDRYEGFVVDLASEIANLVGFNFTIAITNGYGSRNAQGEWNGMIRELLDERADLAMGDLTISYDRELVVDFTMPFLDLGISLLYVKSPEKSINLFSFLSPLSMHVWLLMIFSGVMVSLTMYFIARLSPYETGELDARDGNITPFAIFRHCLWFSVASWVQQGCDFLPRAVSSRTVASFWWFFTLIIISSYTANLAAFLTIERLDNPISSAEDLASQTKIQYGAVASGSTASFFRDSKDESYSKMGRVMSRDGEEVMMGSNQEGVDKVINDNGGYAFFMESTSIEYQVERHCQLQKVGGNLDSKSYGVALPQGSPLRSVMSNAIIKLNEQGKILELKEKWWQRERGGGVCKEQDASSSSVSELSLMNVGGIFLVLLIGLILGVIFAVIEHYWESCKSAFRY